MSYISKGGFLLAPRNEGQLKSHHSCLDCRAWSHDSCTKNRYLREWITYDMRKSVIPVSTLVSLMHSMMHKNRGRVTPRCHRDCKSKIILDNIRTSCNAMRECLKEKQKCSHLFEEEEFETSHWPCDTCLEVLKSIKMFWKIISERIFHIKFGNSPLDKSKCSRSNSMDSLAAAWQKEILNQTVLLKMFPTNNKDEEKLKTKKCTDNVSSHVSIKCSNTKDRYRSKDSISITSYQVCNKIPVKTKQIAAKVKMVDASCDARYLDIEEVNMLKKHLSNLQRRFNTQKQEINNIIKENGILKNELHNKLINECTHPNLINLVPFEHELNDNVIYHKVANTDSEMIITMKNCRHKCFHQVSLLQVIHKTNANVLPFNLVNVPNFQKEDPLLILRKVQNTFDSIVQKEISLATDKSRQADNVDIDASVQRFDGDSNRTRNRTCAYSVRTPSSSSFLSAEEQRLLYKQ